MGIIVLDAMSTLSVSDFYSYAFDVYFLQKFTNKIFKPVFSLSLNL